MEFELAPGPAPLRVVGRRTVRTLEGRLAATPFSRSLPTLLFYLALTAAGELSTVLVSGKVGVLLHGLSMAFMLAHAPLVSRVNRPLSRLLVAMVPIPLIRIVSLTSPLLPFSFVQWFIILALILYAGIVTAIRILKPSLASLGLRLPERRHVPLEVGIALAGILLGVMEYYILKPGPLATGLGFRQLAAPVLIIFVSTGLLEELLFRGLLQKYAGEAVGEWTGILLVTAFFAVLHTGWNSVLDVLFVGSVGLVYALVVRRTRSLVGVTVSHGVTNSMLFLVMPLLAG